MKEETKDNIKVFVILTLWSILLFCTGYLVKDMVGSQETPTNTGWTQFNWKGELTETPITTDNYFGEYLKLKELSTPISDIKDGFVMPFSGDDSIRIPLKTPEIFWAKGNLYCYDEDGCKITAENFSLQEATQLIIDYLELKYVPETTRTVKADKEEVVKAKLVK